MGVTKQTAACIKLTHQLYNELIYVLIEHNLNGIKSFAIAANVISNLKQQRYIYIVVCVKNGHT